MGKLAKSISTSNEQATRAVTQLVESGFVVREKNSDNRRVTNISLTELAHEYISWIRKKASELFLEELSDLPPATAKRLYADIEDIRRILNDVDL